MDDLILLLCLQFAYFLYEKYLKYLKVIDLDFVVTPESIKGDDLVINLDLENVLELKSPTCRILNPKINLKLPKKTFPHKQDTIGFEYELLTYDEDPIKGTFSLIQKNPIILRVQLFDTLLDEKSSKSTLVDN